jgi:hypothetical protein
MDISACNIADHLEPLQDGHNHHSALTDSAGDHADRDRRRVVHRRLARDVRAVGVAVGFEVHNLLNNPRAHCIADRYATADGAGIRACSSRRLLL